MTVGDAGLVLVLNSGSSSIKFQVVDPVAGTAVVSGLVEQIGEPEEGFPITRPVCAGFTGGSSIPGSTSLRSGQSDIGLCTAARCFIRRR